MENSVGAQAQLGGWGVREPPQRGQDPGQWSYLRVVGVGIVVSPGSVQREKHSWAQGPSTRLCPGQHPASREELGAFQMQEGLARRSYLGPGPKSLPKPSLGLLLECKGPGKVPGGSRALSHSHTHTQREMCIRAHPHRGLHTQMDKHSLYTHRHTQTLHALTNADMDSHAQTF